MMMMMTITTPTMMMTTTTTPTMMMITTPTMMMTTTTTMMMMTFHNHDDDYDDHQHHHVRTTRIQNYQKNGAVTYKKNFRKRGCYFFCTKNWCFCNGDSLSASLTLITLFVIGCGFRLHY